jgi:hypothetical protein
MSRESWLPLAVVLAAAVTVLLTAPACRKDGPAPVADAAVNAAGAATPPTRDEVVRMLREVDARLEERRYDGMEQWFGVPTGFTTDELADNLAGLQERAEISARGVDELAARGTFGPAAQVLGDPERVARLAGKFGVPADGCLALALAPAEVVVCRFPDGAWRIVRLDDVGRLP